MATAQQKASAGVYVTDDIGLEVTDGTNSRVQLGLLPTGGAGSYGLRVVSSDGSTVIIDGTSDMFKIAATGSYTVTAAAGAISTSGVTLTGLGTVSTTPAHLAFLAADVSSAQTAPRVSGVVTAMASGFVAASSGGSPTLRAEALPYFAMAYTNLTANPGNVRHQTVLDNEDLASHTITTLYYVLQEAAM